MSFLSVLQAAPPAEAATWTGYLCSSDGCKYGKISVTYDDYGSYARIYEVVDWGATASGTCDTSNDIWRWRQQTAKVKYNTSTPIYYGSSIYKTNCNNTWDTSGKWIHSMDVFGDRVEVDFKHDATCCGAFYPYKYVNV